MENGTSTYDKDIEEYKREHHGLTPAQLIRHTVYGEPLPGQSEEEMLETGEINQSDG